MNIKIFIRTARGVHHLTTADGLSVGRSLQIGAFTKACVCRALGVDRATTRIDWVVL